MRDRVVIRLLLRDGRQRGGDDFFEREMDKRDGELGVRPNYGCDDWVYEYLFDPPLTKDQIVELVRSALSARNDHVSVEDVMLEAEVFLLPRSQTPSGNAPCFTRNSVSR